MKVKVIYKQLKSDEINTKCFDEVQDINFCGEYIEIETVEDLKGLENGSVDINNQIRKIVVVPPNRIKSIEITEL